MALLFVSHSSDMRELGGELGDEERIGGNLGVTPLGHRESHMDS